MADSFVDVTPGTGARFDTRTEATNSENRQVVVIGDPSVNAGVAPVDSVLGLAVNNKGGTTSATAGLTSLASSASSAQAIASNTARRAMIMTNTDANPVYIKFGTTASATSFTYIVPGGGTLEMFDQVFTGRIDAIWSAAGGGGSLYMTELT
jgi:hypothetical protein